MLFCLFFHIFVTKDVTKMITNVAQEITNKEVPYHKVQMTSQLEFLYRNIAFHSYRKSGFETVMVLLFV